MIENLFPSAISDLLSSLPAMPLAEKEALLSELETLQHKKLIKRCQEDFLEFCAYVYPNWKEGPHHRFLKPLLHKVKTGEETRLTVSLPPRFGKSETIAYLFVAWYLGHMPSHHIMMATHTAALSADFGRKVRNLLDSAKYKEVFPDTVVSKDKSAADNWATTLGGKYLAIGIGANVAGHGAHLLVADDLISEQAVLANPDHAFNTAWEYMQVGPLQRLMPGGKIVMIGTRWGKRDPIGRALAWAQNNPDSTPWNEVRFPAILPSGKSLWPEQWPVEQLLAKKAGMQPHFWVAQYMQDPTSEEGALIKREWWQMWTKDEPPDVEFVMQVWDTAHDKQSHNDYSACITWGIWFNENTNRHEIIMLNAIKGRWEFPQLKERALEQYASWNPECLLIEKKAAGAPLIQELRQMDMIVEEYSPSRARAGVSNDKRARVNAVSPLFFDKVVWAPEQRWAMDVINECAEFPNGENDDFVDCCIEGTQILMANGTTRAIEHVQEGDFVHTPKGARRVQISVCTGIHATIRLKTTQGHTIEATPNHPIATTRGWVRLTNVRTTDTIKIASVKESIWHSLEKKTSCVKQWFLTATRTTVIQNHRAVRTANISCVLVDANFYIAPFGSTTTAPYRPNTMFTTLTTIPETTLSKIWSLCQPLNILRSTLKIVRENAPRLCASIWHPFETKPQHGIPVQMVAAGTPRSHQKTFGQVELVISRGLRLGKTARKILISLFAKCVKLRSQRSYEQLDFVARRASVETIALTNEKRKVFNLTVEDAQCFYANGILVHNCCSMALARYRRGGFVSLSSDRGDEPQFFKRKTSGYY